MGAVLGRVEKIVGGITEDEVTAAEAVHLVISDRSLTLPGKIDRLVELQRRYPFLTAAALEDSKRWALATAATHCDVAQSAMRLEESAVVTAAVDALAARAKSSQDHGRAARRAWAAAQLTSADRELCFERGKIGCGIFVCGGDCTVGIFSVAGRAAELGVMHADEIVKVNDGARTTPNFSLCIPDTSSFCHVLSSIRLDFPLCFFLL